MRAITRPEDADYLEKTLIDLDWGHRYNVYVVKIRHEGVQTILPGGHTVIHEGDKVFVVGETKALKNFYAMTRLIQTKPLRSLKQFMGTDYADVENALSICAIKLYGDEEFAAKPIRQSHLRHRWDCLVLGLQKDGYPIIMPDPDMLLEKDDILWVMGSNNNVGALAASHVNLAD